MLAYALATDSENQNKIPNEQDDEARIQYIMDKYRFYRCTGELCERSIYSGGLKSCNEVQGPMRKEDMKCEKCAGIECKRHKEPD
jgi:hypothetical protein